MEHHFMDLLYAFVQDKNYPQFKDFLLTSKYFISFDETNQEINVKHNEHYVDDFWGDNISDLIAIVGDNGAGKTTLIKKIMQWLGDIQDRLIPLYEAIFVTENIEEQKLYVICTEKYKSVSCCAVGIECQVVSLENNKIGSIVQLARQIKTIYFTNELVKNDYQNGKGRYVEDMSYGARMRYIEADRSWGQSRERSDYERFCENEDQRIIEFLYLEQEISNLEIPFLIKEKIDLDMKMINIANVIDEELEHLYMATLEQSAIVKVALISDMFYERGDDWCSIKLFEGLITNFFYENCYEKENQVFFAKIMRLVSGKVASFESIFSMLVFIFKRMLIKLQASDVNTKRILIYIEFAEWLKHHSSSLNFQCDEVDGTVKITGENREELKWFLYYYRETSFYMSYIFFKIAVSSGEYKFLRLFANLYSIVDPEDNKIYQYNFIKKQECKSLIFFLDEADISMHIKWQQKYIEWLTHFVRNVFSGYTVKIVLSTHSPIILSDIPGENVRYLEMGKNISVKNCMRNIKTFGSNIHTLFLDAFFLSNTGTIGSFADAKINEVADILLTGRDCNKDEVSKIIGYIGDELVADRLQEMYEGMCSSKKLVKQEIESILWRNHIDDVDNIAKEILDYIEGNDKN